MERVTTLRMAHLPDSETAAGAAEIAEVAEIVARTINGDPAAFEQIMLRYERRVFTLALRFLGTMDDAQDAAQEVFLRAFKYIHRLDVRRPLEPWLVRMTVNVCRDIGRRRQCRRVTFCESFHPDASPATENGNPYTEFAAEQRRQMLWKALDNLPQKERLAVVLRDVEGLSTAEVAELLGSSETTVRSQISRARLKIREAFDEYGRKGQL